MQNYDPAAHVPGLRDIIIAWIVAVAVCAVLLSTIDLAQTPDETNGRSGLDVAIDEALPPDTGLVADRQAPR